MDWGLDTPSSLLISKEALWLKSVAIKTERSSSILLMGVAMEMRKICLFLEL